MKYTTCIFDFDYTLADATSGIVDSINYALDCLGLQLQDRDSIRKTVGMTLRETFFVLTGLSDEQLAKQFISDFKDMADQVMADTTVLLDDTIDVLLQLKRQHYNTAIVTSKLHYRIDEVLKKYAIAELIDYIVGFEDVRTPKPSPEGLLNAVRYFDADRQSVLYVGDSLIDAQAALNASIDFAAVITGATPMPAFLSLPHVCIVNNLTALLPKLNKTAE